MDVLQSLVNNTTAWIGLTDEQKDWFNDTDNLETCEFLIHDGWVDASEHPNLFYWIPDNAVLRPAKTESVEVGFGYLIEYVDFMLESLNCDCGEGYVEIHIDETFDAHCAVTAKGTFELDSMHPNSYSGVACRAC